MSSLRLMKIFASNCSEAKLSGERRTAGEPRLRDFEGISRLLTYKLITGLQVLFLKGQLNCGANRAAPHDLAKGAERSAVLRSVEIRSAMVLNLAEPDNFRVVVKKFGGVDVNFAREQHAHDQGAYPVAVPMI
jgi:hypothetical protein